MDLKPQGVAGHERGALLSIRDKCAKIIYSNNKVGGLSWAEGRHGVS